MVVDERRWWWMSERPAAEVVRIRRWRRQVHTRGKSMIGTQMSRCRYSLSSQSARPSRLPRQPQKQATETSVPLSFA